MRFVRAKPKRGVVNITPLIDVVFILLVFFMLAGAIKPKDAFPVNAVQSQSTALGDPQELVVLIDADGRLALNERMLPRDQIAAGVQAFLKERPDGLVQLKADGEADAVLVLSVMEDLRNAGVEYLVLLTRGQTGEGAP